MKQIILGLSVLFLFLGCKEQKIPAYITIHDFQFVGNPVLSDAIEGYHPSADVSYVLVYVNGNNLGFYEMPVRIPVLEEGTVNVQLFPAVKQNGISGTVVDYPFYKTFDTTLTLVPEVEYDIYPKTMYKDNINSWIMDFEGANSLNSQPNSLVDMVKITDTNHVKYGTGCGYVNLTGADSVWNARTNSLSNPSGRIWLEVDYKINNSILNTFIAGFSGGIEDEYPYLYFNHENSNLTEWKKIYIDFTENASTISSANYYDAGFTAILDPGQTSTEIYFDNVKLIYFP